MQLNDHNQFFPKNLFKNPDILQNLSDKNKEKYFPTSSLNYEQNQSPCFNYQNQEIQSKKKKELNYKNTNRCL